MRLEYSQGEFVFWLTEDELRTQRVLADRLMAMAYASGWTDESFYGYRVEADKLREAHLLQCFHGELNPAIFRFLQAISQDKPFKLGNAPTRQFIAYFCAALYPEESRVLSQLEDSLSVIMQYYPGVAGSREANLLLILSGSPKNTELLVGGARYEGKKLWQSKIKMIIPNLQPLVVVIGDRWRDIDEERCKELQKRKLHQPRSYIKWRHRP